MAAPSSLSMNRLVRLKELVRVNEDNKVITIAFSWYFVDNSKETEGNPQRI